MENNHSNLIPSNNHLKKNTWPNWFLYHLFSLWLHIPISFYCRISFLCNIFLCKSSYISNPCTYFYYSVAWDSKYLISVIIIISHYETYVLCKCNINAFDLLIINKCTIKILSKTRILVREMKLFKLVHVFVNTY